VPRRACSAACATCNAPGYASGSGAFSSSLCASLAEAPRKTGSILFKSGVAVLPVPPWRTVYGTSSVEQAHDAAHLAAGDRKSNGRSSTTSLPTTILCRLEFVGYEQGQEGLSRGDPVVVNVVILSPHT